MNLFVERYNFYERINSGVKIFIIWIKIIKFKKKS